MLMFQNLDELMIQLTIFPFLSKIRNHSTILQIKYVYIVCIMST